MVARPGSSRRPSSPMRRATPTSPSVKSPSSHPTLPALLLPRSFKHDGRSASVGGRLRSRRWRRKPRMAADPTALLSPTTASLDLEHDHGSVTVSEPSPSSPLASEPSESPVLPQTGEVREPSDPQETILPAYLRQTKSEIQEKFHELEWLQRLRLLHGRQDPDPTSRWAQEQDGAIKIRNRYANVQPWTNNRIHLKVPAHQCDYINASPIVLTSATTHQEHRYIAAQGPRADELAHFWQMVWHETSDPAVIIMLTPTWEAGREKCFPYFPESVDDDTLVIDGDEAVGEDGFTGEVQLLRIEDHRPTRSTIRQLQLTVQGARKTIWHLLFAVWPDFCTPEGDDRAALLRLTRLSAELSRSAGNPRIVHCSAGVGRSGTFIALDHLLRELDEGALDEMPTDAEADIVFDTVNQLREQRMTMVQSDAQLRFIYQLVQQHWLARKTGSAELPPLAMAHEAGIGASTIGPPTAVADRGPEVMTPAIHASGAKEHERTG